MPLYKRPWVWVMFGILVILLPFGIHLSQQVGDRDWWKREATAYNLAHAVPDDDNAALFYQSMNLGAANSLLPSSRAWLQADWSLPLSTSEVTLTSNLAATDYTLDQLVQASRLPNCFYRLDPGTDSFAMLLPHLSRSKAATNLLLWRARASRGNPRMAAEDLMAAARMGFHQDRSLLITGLVGIDCRGLAWRGMERLAMDAPPPPDVLEAMAAEIQALSAKRPTKAERWEVERLCCRGSLEQWYQPSITENMLGGSIGSGSGSKFSLPNPRNIPYVFWLWLAATQPIDRCRKEIDAHFDILSKEKPTEADLARSNRIAASGNYFSGALLPAFSKANSSYQQDRYLERKTRLLLLIRAYRLRNGRYPESLEALKAATKLEIPDDPYSGKPFIYQRLDGDRFLLYSIGENRRDDGGKCEFPPYQNRTEDIVLGRLPKPTPSPSGTSAPPPRPAPGTGGPPSP